MFDRIIFDPGPYVEFLRHACPACSPVVDQPLVPPVAVMIYKGATWLLKRWRMATDSHDSDTSGVRRRFSLTIHFDSERGQRGGRER